ncbi:MAG: lysylphosphatidylglycerol synthase transmembrane domain-containing protein [Leptospira sp.]|nr:lysylphosphatidylglycerol synthase transmembrane domain-containing protein [Leptospira sp.]
MLIKFFFSLVIALILGFVTLRDIDFNSVYNIQEQVNWVYVIYAIGVMLFISILRSIRLKIMLKKIADITIFETFKINSVGYFFIMILPFRIGELAIPILIRNTYKVPMGSILSIVMIERVVDLFVLLIILFSVIYVSLLPPWLIQSAYFLSIMLIVFSFSVFFLLKKTDLVMKLLNPIFKFLPKVVLEKQTNLLNGIKLGLASINTKTQFFYIILIAIIVWMLSAASILLLFWGMRINLGILEALTVMLINVFGISMPAGPGLIGNFQYSCIIALSIFSIDKNVAFSFSMLYYISVLVLTLFFGILSIYLLRVKSKDLKQMIESK